MSTPSEQTKPGVAIYSKEWGLLAMDGVDDPISEAALSICRMYNLGSSRDPQLIYDIIRLEAARKLQEMYKMNVIISSTGDVDITSYHDE